MAKRTLTNVEEEQFKGSTGMEIEIDFIQMKDEIKLLGKKLTEMSTKYEGEKIKREKENFRLVEILTFFTSVMAFIFATVVLFKKEMPILEIEQFLISFAVILIIFNVSGSLFFSISSTDEKRNIKIILLIILVLLLIIINCFSPLIQVLWLLVGMK